MRLSKYTEFTARAGMTIRASTGLEALGEPERMSTVFFCRASPGDRLRLLDDTYLFNVATYAPEVEARLIYTFCYQPNQSWTVYNGDLSGSGYRTRDYVFSTECFFRLCFKRADGGVFTEDEAGRVNEIISFIPGESVRAEDMTPDFIKPEVLRTAGRIRSLKTDNNLVFALLADTHVTVNGTWEDTLSALRGVHGETPFDAVIHLGDMTDGMVTAKATREYVRYIKKGILGMGLPLYIAIGNHDSNYFAKNPEPFSTEEQTELYLNHLAGVYEPWYFVDFPGLRMIFLHSYDHTEKYRYGYSEACLDWLGELLAGTPGDMGVIVFSHLTLLEKLQVWTEHIRGAARLREILINYNIRGGRLLGYINGHNHADQIDGSLGFPVISIGCAKLEEFYEHKPEGSVTPTRGMGGAAQELWDALIVAPGEGKLDFVRFGAGEDRRVLYKYGRKIY